MNLNTSVSEILEAMDRAIANVPKDWEYLSIDEEIMFQVFEMEYKVQPLSDHLGISKELFPPATDLENDEINVIVEKILDLWETYNYWADLPEGLPIRIAYETLLNVWDEPVGCFPFGRYHFDFHEHEFDNELLDIGRLDELD